MAGSISSSVLLGWYQSFYGGKGTGTSSALITAGSAGSSSTTPTTLYAPTAPWSSNLSQPSQSSLVKAAIGGANLFNPSAAPSSTLPNAKDSADYKKLFALYSGLNSLYSIATQANGKNVTSLQLTQLQTAFNNGMAQLQKYLGATTFAQLEASPPAGPPSRARLRTSTTPAQDTTYDTTPLNTTGDSSAVVPAFEGNRSAST